MTIHYTIEQRAKAKTLALAYGAARPAKEAIELLFEAEDSKWPAVPTEASLNLWMRNPDIETDTKMLEQFGNELQLTITGQMRTLLEKLHVRVIAAVENLDSSPADISNLVQAYTKLVDKVQPRPQTGPTFTGPMQLNAPGSGGIMRLFGPKEIEAPSDEPRVIEVEAS